MSGYKRVDFYELCRLCASSQEKEKIRIFDDEGCRLQLPMKIQAALSLKISEDDDLPKVLCMRCFKNLDNYYTFWNECIKSETMLSTYFNKFRYTDDFINNGQVYIKDENQSQEELEAEHSIIYVAENENIKEDPLIIQVTPEFVNVPTKTEQHAKMEIEEDGSHTILTTLKEQPPDVYPEIIVEPNQRLHVATNWGSIVTPTLVTGSGSSKKFECEICKKAFKRREHLYQHVKLHTGFRPFTCELCNKSFMRKEHLLRHIVSHSGLKNYTCDICDKSFSRNDNLMKHKKTHEKESNFVCNICNKHFVMKHYYIAHQLTHEKGR